MILYDFLGFRQWKSLVLSFVPKSPTCRKEITNMQMAQYFDSIHQEILVSQQNSRKSWWRGTCCFYY